MQLPVTIFTILTKNRSYHQEPATSCAKWNGYIKKPFLSTDTSFFQSFSVRQKSIVHRHHSHQMRMDHTCNWSCKLPTLRCSHRYVDATVLLEALYDHVHDISWYIILSNIPKRMWYPLICHILKTSLWLNLISTLFIQLWYLQLLTGTRCRQNLVSLNYSIQISDVGNVEIALNKELDQQLKWQGD